jgi:MFS family permease
MEGKTRLSRDTKMAMISQYIGYALDAYDMALLMVMAPILVHIFTSPKGSAAWQYVTVVLTYSISLAVRPIGSGIFGHYADKIGRRRLLVISIAGVGLMSGVCGVLPTFAYAGVWSYILFCAARFVMGTMFGGEYAVGHTFAIEHAPRRRRGMIGGFVQSGFPMGYVIAALAYALLNFLIGKQAMLDYGWRVMFISGMVPVAFAIYIRSMLAESPEFERTKAKGELEKAPFFSLFKPPALWTFLQVFVLMTGLFLSEYSVLGFLPSILTLNGKGFPPTTFALIYGFAMLMGSIGYFLYGTISDYVGRRRLSLYYSVIMVVLAIPTFYLLYNAAVARAIGAAIVGTLLAALIKLMWGMLPSYLSERFPTKRRAVGVGFGFSSGTLIGAWFSAYAWWIHGIPFIRSIEGGVMWLSPAIILAIGGAMTFFAMLASPETKHLELSEIEDSLSRKAKGRVAAKEAGPGLTMS